MGELMRRYWQPVGAAVELEDQWTQRVRLLGENLVLFRYRQGQLEAQGQGQGDLTRGHVSIRVPGDPTHFYMKPHSFGFDEITIENIVICN